jgi:RHS repeat-associated protein
MAGDANYAKRDLTTLAPFIVNAPLETSVSDASTQVSRLQFLYDHATSTSTPPTIGNLTEEKRRLIQETRWIRTTHDYDSYGNRTLTINPSSNPNGNKIEFAYDATTHAQPISVTVYPDPLDPNNKLITTTEYDSATGLVKNQTDPNGKITETDYVNQRFKDAGITKMDPYGRPGVVTGPAVTSIFDGQPHTDQQRTVITKYFDNDRQVEVISDLKLNGDGLLRNRTTSDRIGRVTKTETSENGTSYAISSETSYKYKPSGQPGMAVFSTNPHRSASADTDGWTRTTQDVLGRTIEVATFGGSPTPPDTQCTSGANCTGTVVTSYDRFYTTVTDQASKQRRSVVDALGRLIRLDEPTTSGLGSVDNPNQKTEYSYDSPGNLIHVVQGLQHRYFKYDSLNRLIRARNVEQGANTPALDLTDPATGNNQWSTGYAYDDASNLLTRTNPNGTTVGFTYDGLNRVKTKTLSVGGAWTYAYDTGTNGKGRLASVTQTGGDGYYYDGYDAVGRVTASHQTTTTTQGGTQSYTLSYGYCLAGNMTKQVYPSGKEYRTDYDNAGRVSQVSRYVSSVFDKTYAAGFSYAAHGAVSAMSVSYGSGTPAMSELTRYNSRLQPTLMETRKVSTNELLLGLDFTYGTTTNNGNMQTQTIRIGGTTTPTWAINQSFTYDELSRLQTATETAGWSQEYGYDRFGNRWVSQSLGYVPDADLCPTQSSHISAATNRIVMNGFSYDTSGNQKTQTRDGQSENYDYDSENRLLSINSGAIGTYVYDGEGRRVKKTDGTGTTVFVYNAGGQLIAEYHSDPVPMPTGGGGTSYLTTDHLGSTRLVTNASGGTKERYDYLPFGEEVPSTLGVRGSVGGYGVIDGTRQKFTQKERDSESGLDYFLARYYSSAQGRFTSPDEFTGGPDDLFDFAEDAADNPTFYSDLHEPQSLNKYQYCYNNPLRYVDPNGHGITDRLKAAARNLKDTAIGVAKEAFNAIAAAGEALEAASQPLGAQRYALNIATGSNMELKPSNATQSVAMKSTFVAALLIGGGSRGASKGASQLSKAVELVSAIGKDKTLVKLAEEAGASAQKGIDALTSQLAKGNLNPGIGTKNLFGNISYARKRDGARVFFRQVEGKIEILAKATKKNEQAVIEKLKKLYQ